MDDTILYRKSFHVSGGDFERAGEVSSQVKSILKALGIPSEVIRRAAIASFEAEMNVVIHAREGELDFTLTQEDIRILVTDRGPGIEDIELAMKEGYSTAPDEMREKGFGAGMGLPNIKKNSDDFRIETVIHSGTALFIVIHHNLS